MTEAGSREHVVLIDEEFVGGRGSVKVAWFVALNDGWIPASQSAGARSKRLETAPGVVWRSRVELELARGARVMRIETRPGASRGSTLDHLTGGARSRGPRVVRARFSVGARGALVPDAGDERRTK